MSGGDASSASRSVNDRLLMTASSASEMFRCRACASDRANAATSDATLSPMVLSMASPLADTGWAAPMCVAGAMAATSAAMVIRNPAEAARAPLGAT